MKKQGLFSMLTIVVTLFAVTSCGSNYEAKEITLATQNDSLNYTLGLSNGAQIKTFYIQNDSNKNAVEDFIKALDKAYKNGEKDEIYQIGYQVGQYFKQQSKNGLMGLSDVKYNEALAVQGIVNALNQFEEGMTAQEANTLLQEAMMKKQQEQFQQQAPASGHEEQDNGSHDGHQH